MKEFQVLLGATSWLYIVRHLPWLAGSFGCCFCDIVLTAQCFYYSHKNLNKNIYEQDAPLIDSQVLP